MRRATKQVEKALEIERKRRKQILAGARKPRPGYEKQRVPNYPSRDTREIAPSEPSATESAYSRRDFSGMGPMAIPAVALGGGLAAASIHSGAMNSKRPKQGAMNPSQSISSGSGPSFTPDTSVSSVPVIIGVQKHGSHPKMWAKSRAGDVEVVVEHTEYLMDLTSAGGVFPALAAPLNLAVNPGQNALFPWLSSLAMNFDEYKFDYLEVTYEPMVGTNTAGKFVATFDPDVLDEYPDSKQQMLEARVQLDVPVWNRAVLKIPKDLLTNWLFVRPGGVPAGADQHVYDVGAFNLALPGTTAGATGELFVSYKVRMRTPNGGVVKAGNITVTGVTLAAPAGTALTPNVSSTLNLTWVSGTTFRFQSVGIFYFIIRDVGTTFTNSAALTAPAGSATPVASINTGSAAAWTSAYIVNVTDLQNVYTIGAPTGAGTLTARSILMFDYDLDT